MATGHKEEGACVGAPSVGSSRVERGEVTTVNVIGVSLPPQRVWGHLHKYCLQNAVSGSATCSEAATCTFPLFLEEVLARVWADWAGRLPHPVLLSVSWGINFSS